MDLENQDINGREGIVQHYNDDVAPSSYNQIMALGYPSQQIVFSKIGYVFSYNFERNVANWVCECLTPYKKAYDCNLLKGKDKFYEDELLPIPRATLDDYSNSVYERGHLAAAANHKYNLGAYCNTFCLSNIAPMYSNVNSFMQKMEEEAQKLAKNGEGEKVYIITGTKFDKSDPVYVKPGSTVQVPDSFFKVIVEEIPKYGHRKFTLRSYEIRNSKDTRAIPLQGIQTFQKELSIINRETGLNILGDVDMSQVNVIRKKRSPG